MRIKEVFEQSKLSKVDVYSKAGISKVAFDDMLKGKTCPKANVIEKVASALGVTCGALFDDWEEHNTDTGLTCPHCGKQLNVTIN